MSTKKRSGKPHRGLPNGFTYADKLAHDRMVRAAVQASANDARVKLETDIRCQRQLWLCCIAMNEAFGIGPERFKRFAEVLTDLSEEYDRMASKDGEDYANEKMRQRSEQITGIKIEYIYEHEMAEARRRNEDKGIHFDDPVGAAIADAMTITASGSARSRSNKQERNAEER